jgi:hypothetical protein
VLKDIQAEKRGKATNVRTRGGIKRAVGELRQVRRAALLA